ncbi:MAG: hypothetical protein A2275_03625 [Bacteroidetes bacterium RIFOXYA12_FULL_35_11]|nr:MAG: hypothetical protein A2X01_05415 [Bacteroidetes bacterium GWF2_35_48]OFY81957.1 MAG: hypothetical protein A2275_03625 [Bacteroidetes bacterium RIFOXYA12_FULL_35_11]OFY94600.1 MAG: hypothetical protein A2309_11575 [Bacteroidetes bacterium RIFOXYB2_FULL_35_7]OFY95723.1 MAG: hypothetical protein A2491_08625 [Bacteroidetes bacterium RIFOXYC12_FULL_35_7]
MEYIHSISTEELNQLPRVLYEGEVQVISSIEAVEEVVAVLKKSPVLGFDTETKPSFHKGKSNRNPVALLQLSTESKVYLFRINKMGLPQSIVDILADPAIIKVGAAVREDIRILQKITPFKAENFIELQDMVKKFDIENFSLKKLAAIILNIRISKSQRLSDWEADELSDGQVRYAATDAWVCHEIYNRLMKD